MIWLIILNLAFCYAPHIICMEKNNSTAHSDVSYYKGTYQHDHWAMLPLLLVNEHVVALASYKNSQYAILLNPTDKRGYRCIIRLIDNNDMSTVLNREYTSEETMGLLLITQLIVEVYNKIVPIVQVSIAGNNAHSFDKETGIISLGKPEEPSILHSHVYGRGNPQKQYIDDVALDGPAPSIIFDMMGKTPNIPGNEMKIPWESQTIKKVYKKLKIYIDEIKDQYKDLGIKIITSNSNL